MIKKEKAFLSPNGNILSVDRPEYKFKSIPDPFWISGFVSGDSSFIISIENSSNKLGKRVRLIFGTCLHIRDKEVLIGMLNYFYKFFCVWRSAKRVGLPSLGLKGGRRDTIPPLPMQAESLLQKYIYDTEYTSLLQIKNYSDIQNKIIPFFNKYPILGVKSLDFDDFKNVWILIKNKEHLTIKGLEIIRQIKAGMNKGRIN